jgi:hypothetical protein
MAFQRPIEDGGFHCLSDALCPSNCPVWVCGRRSGKPAEEGLRFGAIAGLKPDRVNLDASVDRPLCGRLCQSRSRTARRYYSGTVGAEFVLSGRDGPPGGSAGPAGRVEDRVSLVFHRGGG